ncbi:MAG: tetratricopeptide repeat protein [Candidatus Peribacteraceae bacterium]|nr:tetratricopeptide repeat protein [Candidatus Peribacteraceae bacterium]
MCALLGVRFVLRHRAVRKFVRSVKARTDYAAERGFHAVEETRIQRPRRTPRITSRELQEVRALVKRAELAFAREKYEEVERLYIQALTIDPDAQGVQAELAKLYLTTGRAPKAAALYRELLETSDDVSYWSNLGLAYYRQGQYERACRAYQEALNRDAANPERAYALGRACIAAARFEEAAPLLEKAGARLARDTELLHMLAECYMQIGCTESAGETYRRINKLQPYDEQVKAKLAALASA